MPVLDGFGALKRIRQDPRLASLPILAVTAYAMRGDREKILSSGFDGYLSKPVTAVDLERELERLLAAEFHWQFDRGTRYASLNQSSTVRIFSVPWKRASIVTFQA